MILEEFYRRERRKVKRTVSLTLSISKARTMNAEARLRRQDRMWPATNGWYLMKAILV